MFAESNLSCRVLLVAEAIKIDKCSFYFFNLGNESHNARLSHGNLDQGNMS